MTPSTPGGSLMWERTPSPLPQPCSGCLKLKLFLACPICFQAKVERCDPTAFLRPVFAPPHPSQLSHWAARRWHNGGRPESWTQADRDRSFKGFYHSALWKMKLWFSARWCWTVGPPSPLLESHIELWQVSGVLCPTHCWHRFLRWNDISSTYPCQWGYNEISFQIRCKTFFDKIQQNIFLIRCNTIYFQIRSNIRYFW